MFETLAQLTYRRRRAIVAVAVVVAVAAAVLGRGVADRLDPYGAEDPASESVRAERLAERAGVNPGVAVVALVDRGAPVRGRRTRRAVAEVRRVLEQDPAVGRVRTGYGPGGRSLVSRDGRATYVAASFRSEIDADSPAAEDAARRLERRLSGSPGVTLSGPALAEVKVNEIVESDLQRAELLAFPILLLLSFVFFRSLVAALLPLLVGGLSIVLTFFALRVASDYGSISIFALNLVTGMGLGLAIDYSLFIVSRYREEIARTGHAYEAIRHTLRTAGRTVLFSSLTVAAALAALLVFPQRFLYSMGIGGVIVSLIACAIALVVLPAALALLGHRVNALAPRRLQLAAGRDARPASSGGWYRLSRFVMRRPGRIAIATAVLLVALGTPALGIKFTSVNEEVLPRSTEARQVFDRLQRDFAPNQTAPAYMTIDAPANGRPVRRFLQRVQELPGVAAVRPPQRVTRDTSVVQVISRAGPFADRSQDLVRHIRALEAPFDVAVGGGTAAFVDLKSSLTSHMPLALGLIVVSTLLILFLMTGSVVLPLKALVMNMLTLSAAFGILVLIFQDGRLEGVLDYTSQGALESTQPVVLFAIAFGLSTDYGVFLLSRIKEARDSGTSDSEAVAVGLERTGRIVTAAAVLFCIAIGAFATSQIIFIKEVGVGTALAVLIDATLVRALLVPSLMELLGRRNWWAPRPLRRLHARFGLSETKPAGA